MRSLYSDGLQQSTFGMWGNGRFSTLMQLAHLQKLCDAVMSTYQNLRGTLLNLIKKKAALKEECGVLAGVPNKVSCIFLYFIINLKKKIILVSAVPHPVVLCIVLAHEKPTKTFSCFSLSPILSSSSSFSSISWWSAELHFLTVLLFVPKSYNETKHRRSEIKSSLKWEESGQEYTHMFVLVCTVYICTMSMLYNSSLEAASFIYNTAKKLYYL